MRAFDGAGRPEADAGRITQAHAGAAVAARSKARKRALDILFEADVRRERPLTCSRPGSSRAEPPVSPYAIELVQGVQAHRAELDRLLADNSPWLDA